jgi:hypothetical protein
MPVMLTIERSAAMNRILALSSVFVLLCFFTISGALSAQEELPASGFSGKFTLYTDDYNGFKIKIPEEFKLRNKGASTDWGGPFVEKGATGIFINVVEMKGVSSQAMYDGNIQSKQKDRAFVDVTPIKVKLGKKTVYGFWCKDAPRKRGSPANKALDESHTWYLYVFGNDRSYQCNLFGHYGSFKNNKMQKIYTEVIKSFELVTAKEG